MPGKGNSYEQLAREAAARLDQARAMGEQLTFLPDEAAGGGETPSRGKGKALNQMREFMASRGYRMPEELLVEMAGLASKEDAITTAMVKAERVIAWAYTGAEDKEGNPVLPSPSARLAEFRDQYTIQLRALDALMPYGTPKAGQEAPAGPLVQITVPGVPADRAASARDVTPVRSGRMMPANRRWEMEQDQVLGDAEAGQSDGEGRTK